eukprot:scaffold58992_cov32-Tisochrysis_lutea.AAC.5
MWRHLVDKVDDSRPLRRLHKSEGLACQRPISRICQQHLGAAVPHDVGQRGSVKPRVDRVDHATRRIDAMHRLDERGGVGREDGDNVSASDAEAAAQRDREPRYPFSCLSPGLHELRRRSLAPFAVHDGRPLREHLSRAREPVERGERHVVGRTWREEIGGWRHTRGGEEAPPHIPGEHRALRD